MTAREPIETKNLDRYGSEPLPWSRAAVPLDAGPYGPEQSFFLGTVRPDGRPHAAGVGPAPYEGDLYFSIGPGTRKGRNLAASPAATVAVSFPGLDLVLEGEAHRITDPPLLERMAAIFRDGGWPAEVAGDALTAPFSAPSAGPPPWNLYRFRFDQAFGVATAEPWGATRWRFTR